MTTSVLHTEEACVDHLKATVGASDHALADAKAAGLDFTTIVGLISQYGPQAWEIVQKIVARIRNNRSSPPVAPPSVVPPSAP